MPRDSLKKDFKDRNKPEKVLVVIDNSGSFRRRANGRMSLNEFTVDTLEKLAFEIKKRKLNLSLSVALMEEKSDPCFVEYTTSMDYRDIKACSAKMMNPDVITNARNFADDLEILRRNLEKDKKQVPSRIIFITDRTATNSTIHTISPLGKFLLDYGYQYGTPKFDLIELQNRDNPSSVPRSYLEIAVDVYKRLLPDYHSKERPSFTKIDTSDLEATLENLIFGEENPQPAPKQKYDDDCKGCYLGWRPS